jgi:hypothetical protein
VLSCKRLVPSEAPTDKSASIKLKIEKWKDENFKNNPVAEYNVS